MTRGLEKHWGNNYKGIGCLLLSRPHVPYPPPTPNLSLVSSIVLYPNWLPSSFPTQLFLTPSFCLIPNTESMPYVSVMLQSPQRQLEHMTSSTPQPHLWGGAVPILKMIETGQLLWCSVLRLFSIGTNYSRGDHLLIIGGPKKRLSNLLVNML